VHRAENRRRAGQPPGQRRAPGKARRVTRRRRVGYWNVTGKVSVLLAVFFSPSTGCTVAVTV
jgi:hypothetical protein